MRGTVRQQVLELRNGRIHYLRAGAQDIPSSCCMVADSIQPGSRGATPSLRSLPPIRCTHPTGPSTAGATPGRL